MHKREQRTSTVWECARVSVSNNIPYLHSIIHVQGHRVRDLFCESRSSEEYIEPWCLTLNISKALVTLTCSNSVGIDYASITIFMLFVLFVLSVLLWRVIQDLCLCSFSMFYVKIIQFSILISVILSIMYTINQINNNTKKVFIQFCNCMKNVSTKNNKKINIFLNTLIFFKYLPALS